VGKITAVNWADHSWTPWEGCTRRSEGCLHCYAERRDGRNLSGTGSHWGPGMKRKQMSQANWKQPPSWDRAAARNGTRPIVLAGELCDWCDKDPGVPAGDRDRMFELIGSTPHLIWALLTKRTEYIRELLPATWGDGWENVMLGTTVECRDRLCRLDELRSIPAKARYLSIEPLNENLGELDLTGFNWVICGGESGTGARPFHAEWAESILEQCRRYQVPFWMKQLGGSAYYQGTKLNLTDLNKSDGSYKSKSGENWDRWPEWLSHLKIRQKPLIQTESSRAA
jgi:protein gp37